MSSLRGPLLVLSLHSGQPISSIKFDVCSKCASWKSPHLSEVIGWPFLQPAKLLFLSLKLNTLAPSNHLAQLTFAASDQSDLLFTLDPYRQFMDREHKQPRNKVSTEKRWKRTGFDIQTIRKQSTGLFC